METALGLAGQEPPSLYVPPARAAFPAGFERLVSSARGRERVAPGQPFVRLDGGYAAPGRGP